MGFEEGAVGGVLAAQKFSPVLPELCLGTASTTKGAGAGEGVLGTLNPSVKWGQDSGSLPVWALCWPASSTSLL